MKVGKKLTRRSAAADVVGVVERWGDVTEVVGGRGDTAVSLLGRVETFATVLHADKGWEKTALILRIRDLGRCRSQSVKGKRKSLKLV